MSPSKAPVSREERRLQIFKESIDEGIRPKFGYFGYSPSLAVGDNHGYEILTKGKCGEY